MIDEPKGGGTNPKITSRVKFRLHKKEGDNKTKATTHLCLTVIVKELKISVEQGRVITILSIIKH